MSAVAKRILIECKKRGASLASVCREAGINYTTLHAQITHGRKIPFESVDGLSRALKLPLESFSKSHAELAVTELTGSYKKIQSEHSRNAKLARLRALERGERISTDDVLNWLRNENGRLQNFDRLRQRVDLYHKSEATEKVINPVQIGKESLARIWFEIKDENDFSRKVGNFDKTIIDDVMRSHIEVQNSKRFKVDDISINVDIDGQIISEDYRRILANVTDEKGNDFIMVYASLIG